MTVAGESRSLIDGALVEPASGAAFDNVNPATGEVLGQAGDAGLEDADRAIAAARRAFDETDWANDHAFRARCLRQLHEALTNAKEELRQVVVAESGTPVFLTYNVQLDFAIDWFAHWAELAEAYDFEHPVPDIDFMGAHRGLLRREAVGVVSAITPFNFPVYLALAKLGPALAAGCTVVHKPAPETPWTSAILGRLVAEHTDIPAGVVNVLSSSGVDVAEALTTDPRIDGVSFTGSTATGRRIMGAGAQTLKRLFLELGGKNATIVLDDADLMTALSLAVPYACTHAGQGCGLFTRLLLPRSRYDEAIPMLTMGFQNFPYGDPTDPSVLQGPVINERQRDRILAMVGRAAEEGATIAAGGKAPESMTRGFWVEPTLILDAKPESEIAREEVFGPVLVVEAFDDDDDAVRIANDSDYGLTGSVWSANEERALGVARRVRAGTLSVNGGQWPHVTRPFGGYKQSGLGRENGIEGFEGFLEAKSISLPGPSAG